MFIVTYKPSDYQQAQITGSLHTKIIAVGHQLLCKWWLLERPFCFVDFTNKVSSTRLRNSFAFSQSINPLTAIPLR